MLDLHVRGWIGAIASPLTTNIQAFYIENGNAGPVLTSVTGTGGGLTRYTLSGDGLPVQVDQVYFPTLPIGALSGDLSRLEFGSQSILMVGAADGAALWGYSIDDQGGAGSQVQVALTASDGSTAAGVFTAVGGYVYTAMADGQGIGIYAPAGAYTLTQVSRVSDTTDSHAAGLADLISVRLGGADFVIAASQTETGLSSYRVNPDTGALVLRGGIGTENGLGILSAITAIETVTLGGDAYILVASSSGTGEMGALSVLQLTSMGALVATDHVLDTLNTRFGQVQSLATVSVDGHIYIVAGGGDDGISVFTLMPNGRLVHLSSIADSNTTGLQNISALGAVHIGDEVQILAAGQGESGITQLSFSVANSGAVINAPSAGGDTFGTPGNDLLSGSARNDRIYGEAGDDILFDGAGQDTLCGGIGADLFVMQADGRTDQIADFNAAQDRLDLTALPFLHDPTSLEITATSYGAVIEWRGEQLQLYSHDNTPLSRGMVLNAIQTGPDRPLMLLRHDIKGSDGDDTIAGNAGADFVQGLGGNDLIFGDDSGDWLRGGAGHDTLYSGAGDDTVAGGVGRDMVRLGSGNDLFHDDVEGGAFGQDTILADAGNDTVVGGGGDDVVYGHKGYDFLIGGPGNDLLVGGDGFDTLSGGIGNDEVTGGNGRDLAFLGVGDDIFFDNAQGGYYGADTIYAGQGNDTVQGGAGDDEMHGNAQNDLLIGRKGNDRMFGGRQDDTLHGGEGHDVIAGGMGRDLAYLGSGDDIYTDADQWNVYGRDTVFGESGDDTIDAGGGDDHLFGGTGADMFLFRVASGDRRISDFTPGVDQINFAWAPAAVSSADTPDGLLLSWHNGSVLLDGIVESQIIEEDFIFL